MARLTTAGHSAHAILSGWPIALLSTGFFFDGARPRAARARGRNDAEKRI